MRPIMSPRGRDGKPVPAMSSALDLPALESSSWQDRNMATEKVSLTLEEELVSEARATAGIRCLSRYVNRALRHQLQRDRLDELLDEHEPIDPHRDRDDLERLAAGHPVVHVLPL